jgi:hypothetical protein
MQKSEHSLNTPTGQRMFGWFVTDFAPVSGKTWIASKKGIDWAGRDLNHHQ